MDKGERQRLKQLTNDAIIDLFGSEGRELKLATALEACLEELEDVAQCPHCDPCDNHNWIT